ncbi:MAG: hypothetical protein ACRD2U_11015 [Terriglobales bacterium]
MSQFSASSSSIDDWKLQWIFHDCLDCRLNRKSEAFAWLDVRQFLRQTKLPKPYLMMMTIIILDHQ